MHQSPLHLQERVRPMTGLEVAARQVAQEWHIRMAAAEDLLGLVDEELAEMQRTVDGLR